MIAALYQDKLLERIQKKFENIDWIWEGDGEYDERRLYPTLDFTEESRDSKLEYLKKIIIAEGYGS
jgi:hypothetical protein